MAALAAMWIGSGLSHAQNVLYNGDFEADPFLDGWTVSTNVVSFGGIAPGSTTAAMLVGAGQRAGQTMVVWSDWSLDFFFAIRDAGANRAFSLLINQVAGPESVSAATINLRYQSGQFNTYAAGAWGSDLGLGTINPSIDANGDGDFNDPGDAKNVYHMRITGAAWGLPAASYSIELSDANTTNLTRAVNGLTRYQNGSGVNGGPNAFVFNTSFGSNPGFWIDDVTHEAFYMMDDPNLELTLAGDLFGRLPVDSPPVTRTLEVTNSGALADLRITNGVLSGPDASHYTVNTQFPISIPPASAANISIAFDPGADSRPFTAALVLESNDPSTPAFNVNLAATRLTTGSQQFVNPGFESSPYDSGWIVGTNISQAGGLISGSASAARLGAGTRLGQQIVCSPDWHLDFYCGPAESANESFSLYVTSIGDIFNTGEIKLRVQCRTNEWVVAGAPRPELGAVVPSIDANGDGDLADAEDVKNVYRLRIVGHSWDTTNSAVDVLVSDANSSAFARGIFGIAVNSQRAVPYAFAFDSLANGNPGFWVDETRVVVGLPPAERPTIGLFQPENGMFRMTWTSEPNASYRIETVDDLGKAWQSAFGPIPSQGFSTSYTNTAAGATRFFRIRVE
ncbi:MAG: hypothetical protein KA118_09140 [Verrucomicrobia bacterium]|nr:hypothetical protein [Verrucomicrobiota bacterium]